MSGTNLNAIDEFGTRDSIAVDGSETKLAAGVNTTLTGNGTAVTPYIVDVKPKVDICYELTESTTTTFDTLQYSWVQGQFDNGQFLNVFNTSPPPGVVGSFAPIIVHDGTNWVAPATLQAELVSKVLPLFQTQWPQLDSVKVSIDGSNTLFVDFYDSNDPTVDYSSNGLAIGGTGSQAFIFGPASTTITTGAGTIAVREVQVNGGSAYYENGVLVTSSTRVAQLKALIDAASTSAVVLCIPDGSETVVTAGTNVTVTGSGTVADPYVVSSGDLDTDQQTLALSGYDLSISNGNSVTLPAPDGSETIVTAGTYTTVTGSGTVADPYVVTANNCIALFETETFVATAGQTAFVVGAAPSGDVRLSRNGAALADAAATVSGSTVTYVPSANGGVALLAGDRIEISYVYNYCESGAAPTIVDGSETKVTAGANVTVTGTGTIGNPYVVSSSGAGSPVLVHAKYASKAFGPTASEVSTYSSVLAESVPGTFNLLTGRFAAPTDGWYRVSAMLSTTANWSANQYVQINFLKNGVSFDISQSRSTGGNLTLTMCGEAFVYCVAGDTLSISLESGQNVTTSSDSRLNEFLVMQIK